MKEVEINWNHLGMQREILKHGKVLIVVINEFLRDLWFVIEE
jgi:hypothetical protein